ncbi:carboxypeptidase regulatory-like domain-containing protein [Pontibacter qinzhouensis]|uniref:Carboxypeptidase regulatory-like domain-containing protein n=1 Tax=Pontibacter qinzhouensis TaxID=2603253 RepID=A0A5C8K4V5_9BACT|nr:carboxypeptidase regulatory-like domain-containing protein [Pontibacter qinzhouensis]TXK45335.1 carboxypeptidase regulatory-like domain-containing protein [Pontibacter qinzhouensis]
MNKLLLLPLFLLANCSSSTSVQQYDTQQMETTTEQVPQDQELPTGVAASPAVERLLQAQKSTLKQGIAGRVLWVTGNQMPSPDVPRSSGKKGVQRQVFIYQLTKGAQATTIDGVFHTNIQTNLVTQVVTDANGYFAVSLEPGHYSVFSKEEQGLFANLFDGEGHIFPVEVKQGEVTPVEFLINYNATY